MQIFYNNLCHVFLYCCCIFVALSSTKITPFRWHPTRSWVLLNTCLSWWPTTTHTCTHTDNFLCLAALACSIWSSTSTMTSHIYTLHRTSPFPVKNKHSDQSPRIPTHCTQLLFSISVWLHSPCSHSHIVDNCMHSHTHDGEPLPLSLPDLACSILPSTFSDHSPHTHWLMLHSSLSPVSSWLQLEQTWTETSHAHSHTNYPELPDLACSVLPRIHSDHRHAAST